MQFILRYFPEIIIKSRPVRKQMARQLQANLQTLLRPIDEGVRVIFGWDRLTLQCQELSPGAYRRVVEVLRNTPGIANFMDVAEYPLVDLSDIADRAVALWGEHLAGQTLAVRCHRRGRHGFSSGDVERAVGAALLRGSAATGVDLGQPDCTVRIEVLDDRVYIVRQRFKGLGGYPIGAIDAVLSLVSGGFDSTVASYQMMKRGLLTHFLFFNLGGHAHEIGVKEVAVYLWMKFGASHPVSFVSVPFESVVGEILRQVDDRYMGVVLKRMMLRVADQVAERGGIGALVTGESVAQVSSQTLHNLAIIDRVSERLVLRPLIALDKGDIVDISRAIGAEAFAASMPEYCGVISVKPTTRARLARVVQEEAKCDPKVLAAAMAAARRVPIDQLALQDEQAPTVEVLAAPLAGSAIIDLRHPNESESAPLCVAGVDVLAIPFYELHRRFAGLDQQRHYMLYCDQGVMSRLHAAHLVREGHGNVSVYRPD